MPKTQSQEDANDYARYVNVTLIDDRGCASSAQLFVTDKREALEYMENAMMRGHIRKPYIVAAFIFDTLDSSLLKYMIDGQRGKLF